MLQCERLWRLSTALTSSPDIDALGLFVRFSACSLSGQLQLIIPWQQLELLHEIGRILRKRNEDQEAWFKEEDAPQVTSTGSSGACQAISTYGWELAELTSAILFKNLPSDMM
ncbi:hypothetical protein Tco_1237930 [Tanacetum coccineum]